MTGGDHVILCQGMALHGAAPEWVHLLPQGRSETVDGRGPFLFEANDAQAIIDASLKSSPDGKLVIDINHSTDIAAPKGEPSPAQGWITELQARADGLWGRVEWTAAGKALLADKAYRFVSPVIVAAKGSGKIVALLRASLTNNPNLRGLTPVLNATTPMETDMTLLLQLLAALGLPEASDEQTALAAVTSLKSETSLHAANLARIAKAAKAKDDADLDTVLNAVTALADTSKTVPLAVVTELRTELNTAVTQLKALKDDQARDKAQSYVDAMIAAGKPGVKPLRDHYISRHMADPAGVEKELNAQISLTAGGTVKATPPEGGQAALDDADLKVAQMLGVSADDYKKTKAALGQEVI